MSRYQLFLLQAALDKLHQPFYQTIVDRLSSVHYDSQLSYGPPPDQQGESTPPQLDPEALAALRPFQTLHSRLYTGLLLLGGVTPSDHSDTLSGLVGNLRGRGCYVAHMSMAGGLRRGANEALRGLVKQLVGVELEVTCQLLLRLCVSFFVRNLGSCFHLIRNGQEVRSCSLGNFNAL